MNFIKVIMCVVKKQMAHKVGVACVPGTSFFREDVRDIVRVHFAKKDETLLDALNRLESMRGKMSKRV